MNSTKYSLTSEKKTKIIEKVIIVYNWIYFKHFQNTAMLREQKWDYKVILTDITSKLISHVFIQIFPYLPSCICLKCNLCNLFTPFQHDIPSTINKYLASLLLFIHSSLSIFSQYFPGIWWEWIFSREYSLWIV